MKDKAIAFLCVQPHEKLLDFANQIFDQLNIEVYIIVDDFEWKPMHGKYTTVQIADDMVISRGYVGSNIGTNHTMINKRVVAMDKCLYWFCECVDYRQIWFFEDDVFIPSIDALKNLITRYSKYDLITPNNFKKTDAAMDWHWKHIFESIKPPYYYSMVCAMGISKKVLRAIKQYVEQNNKLFYLEAMFNTIAMQKGYRVVGAKELKSIVWLGDWTLDQMVQLPNNIYHPIKNISEHPKMRLELAKLIKSNYKATDVIPEFLL
jgi:hypothetical protein